MEASGGVERRRWNPSGSHGGTEYIPALFLVLLCFLDRAQITTDALFRIGTGNAGVAAS